MGYFVQIGRCVKEGLAIQSGTYRLIWNDRGSGADRDVALWANSAAGSYLGIDANTFKAFTHYGQPHDSPFLLNSQYAKGEGKKIKITRLGHAHRD